MRHLLFATIVFEMLGGTGIAAGYLLQLRVVGYQDAPANAKPEEREMRKIIIPVTIGVPFSERLVRGRRTLAASGTVIHSANGKFTIRDFKFQDQVDSGDRIPDGKGHWKPVLNGSTIQSSSADVGFGKNGVLAGDSSETDRTNPDGSKERLVSKTTYTVRLLNYEPRSKATPPAINRWRKLIREIFRW